MHTPLSISDITREEDEEENDSFASGIGGLAGNSFVVCWDRETPPSTADG